jgi:aspartate aminotransferase/aminotransferase
MAFMAILNPGDEVIIHEPAWVSYSEQVKLCHAVPVMVPHTRSIAELESFVTPRTRAITLNYPHNPRGRTISRDELECLHSIARRHGLFLVSDEAYSDFLLDHSEFTSCAASDPKKEHSIVCNSISKNFGMSGWRIGYVITNPDLTYQILKINQHLVTCPSSILQFYVEKYFERIIETTRPQIAQVVQKRKKVLEHMDSLGVRYLPGSATYYVFVSIEGSSLRSEDFSTRLLREHRVSVVPGVGYGESCDRFIRVSVGTESMERTLHGVEQIHRLVEASRER